MTDRSRSLPPLLRNKHHGQPSEFVPDNLLREARRQKGLAEGAVPRVCVLDPDGDIVRYLCATGQARANPYWACYHTELYDFVYEGIELGIIGCAVGASFAVLVAEQLFASGCELLISMTSSGQIAFDEEPPFFVLIEQALRDEGTSYHYQPPADYAAIEPNLRQAVGEAVRDQHVPVYAGSTWTTDAPFRETASAIEYAAEQGIAAVEMEAAALYAFASARQKPVVCFAHVTNQMGNIEGDFEKGEGNGSHDALHVIALAAQAGLAVL